MSVSTRPTKSGGTHSRGCSETALFRKAQAGCRESLNRLMAQHDGLVQAAVRRQGLACTLTFPELLQVARTGLWHAIRGYDPARGKPFATYAWPCIVRQVWRAVKRNPPASSWGQERAAQHATDQALARALAPDPAEEWETHCVEHALRELLARLPYRLYRVTVARYGLGLDGQAPAQYQQIGARLGLCGERARQLQVEALIWLRQPAHSQALRSLLSLHTAGDYQRSHVLAQAWRSRHQPPSRRREATHAQGQ